MTRAMVGKVGTDAARPMGRRPQDTWVGPPEGEDERGVESSGLGEIKGFVSLALLALGSDICHVF